MSVITELSGEPSSPGMQSFRRWRDNSDQVALKFKGCGVKVSFGRKGGKLCNSGATFPRWHIALAFLKPLVSGREA